MTDIDNLSDRAAVKALALVARKWIENRGLEAFLVAEGTRKTLETRSGVPAWAKGKPIEQPEAAKFSRRMLIVLVDATDKEVARWTRDVIKEVRQAEAQMIDPITLAISGAILIGAILAARVSKIGPVEFYKGVPKELADVVKAGASSALSLIK